MQTESSEELIDFNDKLIRNESDGIFPNTDMRFIGAVIILIITSVRPRMPDGCKLKYLARNDDLNSGRGGGGRREKGHEM